MNLFRKGKFIILSTLAVCLFGANGHSASYTLVDSPDRETRRPTREVFRDSSGAKAMTMSSLDGVLHGKNIAWYPNGHRKVLVDYYLGEKNGRYRVWGEDGSLMLAGQFVAGEPVDDWICWDSSGQRIQGPLETLGDCAFYINDPFFEVTDVGQPQEQKLSRAILWVG